jgi:PAS domain S-box-containing protein
VSAISIGFDHDYELHSAIDVPAAALESGLGELQRTADDYLFTVDLAVVLFQSSPDAIVVVAAEDGAIRLVNSQAEFLTGYHRSELRGQKVEMLLPEMVRERHVTEHRKTFLSEPRARSMGREFDLRLRRKNGDEVGVDINLSPVVTIRGMFVIATIRRKTGG